MSKYLCADCVLREQCDGEWTTNCASYKKTPLTNEEWLRSATTEELAYILRDTYLLGYTHGHNGADIHGGWSEWLKEKHTDA